MKKYTCVVEIVETTALLVWIFPKGICPFHVDVWMTVAFCGKVSVTLRIICYTQS